ncbi:hypothetical protein F0562_014577 [Nyssa sinensis]|uniref:R13L1/DRL21-like LRR repeat region domain-containing protein n=1 Tax=Nyssa sinensis TaxID=561372 RepID=A0A5J4ZTA5_9ASTE|nr:hypothetical protein F0562_014577 [Nyssa sinensis]
MFRTLKYIRVLDLSSSVLEELPNSIEELKLLRYLDLSKTEIRRLPDSICSLYNLQVLKLLGCLFLFELPKNLGNLVNLQHLELDEMFWYKLSVLPPRMGNLKGLQNLHAFSVGHESGCGIEELKDMVYLTGTLHISKLENTVNAGEAKLKEKERLKKVVFEWNNRDGGQQDEAVLEDLQPHSNLKELEVLHYRGTGFPLWIRDGLLQNLATISLKHCTKCKVLSLGQLPHLGELYIKGMQELEEWPDVQYPSLTRLKISSCPKLKKLPKIFLNLRVLKVKKCDSLRELPLSPSLMFLILVDNLVLENWNEAILRLAFVNEQGQLVSQQNRPSYISLIELKIINCPKLQALPEHFAPQKLEIRGCELLSALPIPEHFQRLQHLSIDACHDGTLVRAIPDTGSLYSLVISNISNLASLPKWPHLPGLKALYIRDCKDLVSLSEEETSFQSLTSLKLLSIRDCPKLVSLPDNGLPTSLESLSIGSCPSLESFGPKEMLKSLTILKDLYIEDCPALQSFPEEGLPHSLQHLHVEGCPSLTKHCEKDRGSDWSKIMHIPDLELESIKVSSVPNSLSKEEHPKIKTSSAFWKRRFTCCKGIDIIEIGGPQQLNRVISVQTERGLSSRGKMMPGEPSTSTEHGE